MRTPYVGCPLCQSEDTVGLVSVDCSGRPQFRRPLPDRMNWCGCNDCGHVFVDGYFTAEALAILFDESNESLRPGDHAEQKRLVWARTVARVAEFKSQGRWCDVGFGDGAAMFTAAEWGYEVEGVDIRKHVVEAMRSLGFTAHHGTTADVTGPFDIVSMFDVLEHTPFPSDELRNARDLLNPGGLIVISCPNMGCFTWDVLDAQQVNPYWGEIEHYHNFTRQRLVDLLDLCGFEFVSFNVSDRWRLGMEIIARKVQP